MHTLETLSILSRSAIVLVLPGYPRDSGPVPWLSQLSHPASARADMPDAACYMTPEPAGQRSIVGYPCPVWTGRKSACNLHLMPRH